MMKRVIGEDAEYALGFTPSRMPPWGGGEPLLELVSAAETIGPSAAEASMDTAVAVDIRNMIEAILS